MICTRTFKYIEEIHINTNNVLKLYRNSRYNIHLYKDICTCSINS